MAENSKIEWTHHTANPWWGCTKVHAGCDHCYAEALSRRFEDDLWGDDKLRRSIKAFWKDLLKYQKKAAAAGEIHRVFIGSMMDIFEKSKPLAAGAIDFQTTGEIRESLFDAIKNGLYDNLQFLFLTKRPSNINKMIPEEWKINPPANVIFGASVSDQETANTIIPLLLQVKGKKFISLEPMIDMVSLDQISNGQHWLRPGGLDWVIVGGESGRGKRPFNPEWARHIRNKCHLFSVPFFMKQIDKVIPVPEDLMIRQFPK